METTATRTVVREATRADVPTLVSMAMDFLKTEYAGLVDGDPTSVSALAQRFIDADDAVALVVEDGDGQVSGMMGLSLYTQPVSQEQIGIELVWWMNPNARGAGGGVALLAAAETWARAHGATKLQMIAPNERVGQWYERHGFTRTEIHYQRPL